MAAAAALLPNEVEHGMTCGNLDSNQDVILRIRKTHADDIVSGEKNHEYRRYRLEPAVTRLWLYVDEEKTIEYVLTIGLPKTAGQVNDSRGLGNDDFDNGLKVSPFGYPILAVHKLPNALTIDTLLKDHGVDMIARGKQYAKSALVQAFPLQALTRVIPK